ncbi:MAG: CtsR family transcriptional regulator [Clostridia bacterium]|nr:CtsR family transcriptional regulator [Clostridia bacterium]
MKLSNMIEEFIKELLSEEREIELQRNELATHFNCVPSQINYVIATRFSPERGYFVESRRGSGGYIKITRAIPDNGNYILHTVNSIGNSISAASCRAILGNLYNMELLSHKEIKILMAALSDNSLILPRPQRDIVRASIFKNILINII